MSAQEDSDEYKLFSRLIDGLGTDVYDDDTTTSSLLSGRTSDSLDIMRLSISSNEDHSRYFSNSVSAPAAVHVPASSPAPASDLGTYASIPTYSPSANIWRTEESHEFIPQAYVYQQQQQQQQQQLPPQQLKLKQQQQQPHDYETAHRKFTTHSQSLDQLNMQPLSLMGSAVPANQSSSKIDSTPRTVLQKIEVASGLSHSSDLSSATASASAHSFLSQEDLFGIQEQVFNTCRDILFEALSHCLKAVELANTLRARIGTETMALVREHYGGLLSLLEMYPCTFQVERIPKSDKVSLTAKAISANCALPPSVPKSIHSLGPASGAAPAPTSRLIQQSKPSRAQVVQAPPPPLESVTASSARLAHQQEQLYSRKIQIDGLSVQMPDETMFRELAPYGEIDSVQVLQSASSKSKSLVITFRNLDSAMKAKTGLSTGSTWFSNVYFLPMDSTPQIQKTSYQQHSLSNPTSAIPTGSETCPVLAKLCDETFVPSQLWTVNLELDMFYIQAVVSRLQQFGGTMAVSKLRGFLRSRLNILQNIKSVPLKAMLSAYPQYFLLSSSQVSLSKGAYHL